MLADREERGILMNRKKFISIITIIALMLTTVVPALGAGGDGTGSTEWPFNLAISNTSIETTDYKLGTSKEFTIGYYPGNVLGASFKGTRHIEITGPVEVTDFQYSEDGNSWQDINSFESEMIINTSKVQKMRVTFHEAGLYTIRFWMTSENDNYEITRTFYVSDFGISRIPPAPADLKETNKKMRFQWSWDSDLSATFNFYIDGDKINDTPITATKYDVLTYADRFTPGIHIIAVEAVHMLGSESLVSEMTQLEYTIEEPTTEVQTTEETTTEESTTEAQTTEETTTEESTTEAQTTEETTTEESTTEAQTTGETTTEESTTEAQTTEAPITEQPTTEVPTTQASETTTKVVPVVTTKLKLAKGKIKKAIKKASAKKVKITFKKIKKATSYEVQICKNKKFKKKNTITKKVKKTKCTFKKLKPNKKYYVRVRAVAKLKGKKVYGKWSKKTKIKRKK